MAQTIKLKRSSVSGNTPSTSDLELGEVAINTHDGKMFIKKNDGSDSIVEIGGTSGTVTDAFKTIAVSGQTSVVADSATDTLTFVAGTNMTITTNAGGDTITFASTGSSGSSTFLGLSDSPANFSGAAGKYLKVNSSANSIEFDTLNFDDLGTTPTTIAGYGITDALQLGTSATTALAGNTSIPSALTDLSISDGSSGQVLQTDGSGGFSFVNQTGGNSFGTIAVSGQSNVVADQGSDTLTLVAGSNVTLTTNAGGDSVTIASSGGGSSAADAIFEEYQFNATGGQTTFTGSDNNSQTLSYTADAIQVFLNGVFLDPAVDYTATNGTSIVLAETVDANDYLQIIAYKKKISDGQTTVDTFSGNGSTTAFTLSLNPGDENNTRVFIDGVYQSKSNYAVSGTTLTFSTAPPNGTAVEVEIGNRVVTLDTTASIDLPDNVQLRLGTDQDMKLYHTGAHGVLTSSTGDIRYQSNTRHVFSDVGFSETHAVFNDNGAVQLYYDNGQKFATTNTGVSITGDISNTSGNLTLDVAGDIVLDADGGDILLKDNGAHWASLYTNGTNTYIQNMVNSGDVYLSGKDGSGNGVNALTLDMSAAGEATFNAGIKLGDGYAAQFGASQDLLVYHSSNENIIQANTSDQDLLFKGKDGSSTITALTLDMSDAGSATFNSHVSLSDSKFLRLGNDADFIIYHDSATNYVQAVKQDSDIIFRGNDGGTNFNALTLDMSAAGAATFNSTISSGAISANSGATNVVATFTSTDGVAAIALTDNTGTVELSATGTTFGIQPNGGAAVLTVNSSGNLTTSGTISSGAITANGVITATHTDGTHNISLSPTSTGGVINARNSSGTSVAVMDGRGTPFIDVTGNLKTGGTIRIDSSGNLSNIGTISSGAITSSGAVNANTINSTSTIATGYGVSLTSADTNYLFYGNSGSDLFYMRDTTNSQMITTWSPNYFQVNKAFYVAGNSSFTGTISSGAITSTGASSFTDLAIGGSANSSYDLLVYGLSRFQGVANFVSASNPIQVGGTTIIDASRNLTNIGTISTGTAGSSFKGPVYITEQNSTGEGGEITLNGSNGNTSHTLDTVNGTFRIFDTSGTFISGNTGYGLSTTQYRIAGTQVIDNNREVMNVTLGNGTSGARFEANGWVYDTTNKARFYFEGSGRTFYGANNGHSFRGSADNGVFTISNTGGINVKAGGADTMVGDSVAFAIGGSTVINSSGDIILSGSNKLYLTGAAGTDYLEFDDDSGTYASSTNVTVLASKSDMVLRTNTNDGGGGNFTISTGGSSPAALFFINKTSGNVGIGTGSSASSRLHVKSASRGSIVLKVTDSDTTSDILRSGAQADGDGYLQLRTIGGAGNVLFDASGVSYVTGGNFGIGETNPLSPLVIKRTDNTVFNAADTSGQDQYGATLAIQNLSDTNNTFSQLLLRNRNSSKAVSRIASLTNGTGTDMVFVVENQGSNPGEVMRINKEGEVGIGLANSIDARLAVSGEMRIHSGSAYITHFNYQNTGTHYISQANSGSTIIRNNSSSLVSVTSSGNISFHQAGAGINFSNAANSHGGATSSVLDDYEEGTWTPAWVGTTSTITVNNATYTKIGNVVTAHMYISDISPATSGDQQRITGLPFVVSTGIHYPAGSIGYSGNADVANVGVIAANGNDFLYFHYLDGTSSVSLTRNNWNSIKSSGLALLLSITYRTDE